MSDFQGEGAETFLLVLDDPAGDFHDDGELNPTPTSNLLTIYRQRAQHVREIGLPTLGFDEAVERIETSPHGKLCLAVASGPGGHPWAVAFLAPDQSEVVAVIAVLDQVTPA